MIGNQAERQAGFSLLELLVVVAILGTIILVTVPNLVEWNETNLLQSSSRQVAAYLKLGRMKAVSSNVTYIAEIDGALQVQCPGYNAAFSQHGIVVYRANATTPSECMTLKKNVRIESVGTGALDQVSFKSNGMAINKAPNWFLVRGRVKNKCQLICVNVAGAVRMNRITTDCAGIPYGADGSTRCEPPI